MERGKGRRGGYAWAISAGLNAALAAISAKLFSSQVSLISSSFHLDFDFDLLVCDGLEFVFHACNFPTTLSDPANP